MKRFIHGLYAPALLALLAFVRVALSAPADPDVFEPERVDKVVGLPYTEEAHALLGDLQAGATVEGGWEVTDTYGPVDGSIMIVLTRGEDHLEVRIVRRGSAEGRPLVFDHRWEYLYNATGPNELSAEEDVRPVMEALSERLDREAEIPLGM